MVLCLQLPLIPILDFSMELLLNFLIMVMEVNILIILIILILKYRVIQKEAGFTGLCMNQIILSREYNGQVI